MRGEGFAVAGKRRRFVGIYLTRIWTKSVDIRIKNGTQIFTD